jgi:alkylated DNA repair dioxygenase AlkB
MIPPGLSVYSNIIPNNIRNSLFEYLWEMEEDNEFQLLVSAKDEQRIVREIMQFGYEYKYSEQKLDKIEKPIPPILSQLINLIPHSRKNEFNQCEVNHFKEGYGHHPQIDNFEMGDIVAIFSLGDTCPILFRNKESDEMVSKDIHDNSLILLERESRYKWFNEMEPLTQKEKEFDAKRYTITFRIINRVGDSF